MSSFTLDSIDDLLHYLDNCNNEETALNTSTPPNPMKMEEQITANANTTNDPCFNSGPDEQDLLNYCYAGVVTGQTVAWNTATTGVQAEEEILCEFVLNERGEVGPVPSLNDDHAYTVQLMPQPTEDQDPPPPADRASSPRTRNWTNLDEVKEELSGPSPMLSLLVIESPENCKYSEHNFLYHIKSQGKFSFKALLNGLPFTEPENQFGLQMYLRRTHPDYSHIDIDTVCPAHQNGIHSNPIHPLTDSHKFTTTQVPECGAAQLFNIGKWPGPESEVTLNISFPCEDSCVRASSRKDVRKEKAIEKARDSELVVKLVLLNRDSSIKSFLAEMSIPVWIKASINERDLVKPQRRKPKGAAAQMAAQKRKAEERLAVARDEPATEKKKIKLEEIDNATFKERVIQKN